MKEMVIPKPEYYDVIFCRNLLIYFDRKTQKDVLEKLHFMLKPGGMLFVGHAETSGIEKKYFVKMDKPKAFAYTKKILGVDHIKTSGNDHTNKLTKIYKNLVEITQKDVILSKKIKVSKKKRGVKCENVKNTKTKNPWEDVERMLEDGQLKDASILCEKRLKQEPHNAQAYYYLAVISKLEGGFGAAELLLKKAVYLDPNHHRALSLFCLLAEKRGDVRLVQSLKNRTERVIRRSHSL